MSRIFVDTAYWIALLDPADGLHTLALEVEASLEGASLVTTDLVVAEVLNCFSKLMGTLRDSAGEFADAILRNPQVHFLPLSRAAFAGGVARYRSRPDKSYSLTDCVSMNAMDALKIGKILTSDRHFEQEGYEILLKA